MTAGEYIRQRRIELGITQDELAQRLGYASRSSVNKAELANQLTLKTIRMYASELSIDVGTLVELNNCNNIVSTRLKEALHRKGYSQQDLADLTGINKASISQYVNGSHAPSFNSAKNMAHYLDVSPEYLMGYGEDNYNHIFEAIKRDAVAFDHIKKVLSMNEQKKEMVYEFIDFVNTQGTNSM